MNQTAISDKPHLLALQDMCSWLSRLPGVRVSRPGSYFDGEKYRIPFELTPNDAGWAAIERLDAFVRFYQSVPAWDVNYASNCDSDSPGIVGWLVGNDPQRLSEDLMWMLADYKVKCVVC